MPEAGAIIARAAHGGMQIGRRLATAAALLAFAVSPVQALPPDQESLDLIAQLEQLDERLQSGTDTSNALLVAGAGVGDFARPGAFGLVPPGPLRPPSQEPADLIRMNTRLALTSLAQAFGGDDNFAVMAAQDGAGTGVSQALAIRSGDATLADLRAALGVAGQGPLVMRVPLVVLAGASLTLSPGDELWLSRIDGAFVVNFGDLFITGATIASTLEPNLGAHPFRPFVTTTEGGTVTVRGARFVGLGFGRTLKYSGFSILRSILSAPERPSVIEDSTFQDLLTVAISGDTDVLLRGNRFRDMRSAALTVSRTRGARVLSNLFFGTMTTNAVRLQDGSADGVIAGNIILGGERAGILVREHSTGAVVANNVIWNRTGGGITVLGADCGLVQGNLVIANDQKGIEVRDALAAQVLGNTIFSNDSAGLWVSNQPPGTQTVVEDNVIAFNGAGVAGANTGRILMHGNDFSRQYQQFLAGDLALQTEVVARQMTGAVPYVIVSGIAMSPEEGAVPTNCPN